MSRNKGGKAATTLMGQMAQAWQQRLSLFLTRLAALAESALLQIPVDVPTLSVCSLTLLAVPAMSTSTFQAATWLYRLADGNKEAQGRAQGRAGQLAESQGE